jgi:membrane protease subunit HflK
MIAPVTHPPKKKSAKAPDVPGANAAFQRIFYILIRLMRPLSVLALIVLCFSGIHKVENGEIAMVLRLGRLVGSHPQAWAQQPGLRFALPRVVDEVVRVPVGKVRQITVKTHAPSSGAIVPDVLRNGYLITGDSGILLAEAAVKYRIDDPRAYALSYNNAERIIDGCVSGVLQSGAAAMRVDDLLTAGKAAFAENAKRAAQVILDELDCGIVLVSLELTRLVPPYEVKADFDAVTEAAVKKRTLLEQASEYRVNTLPAAQSQARKAIEDAKARQSAVLAQAQTDVAVFNGLYEQYASQPALVVESALRGRLSALLSRMRVVVLDGGAPHVFVP